MIILNTLNEEFFQIEQNHFDSRNSYRILIIIFKFMHHKHMLPLYKYISTSKIPMIPSSNEVRKGLTGLSIGLQNKRRALKTSTPANEPQCVPTFRPASGKSSLASWYIELYAETNLSSRCPSVTLYVSQESCQLGCYTSWYHASTSLSYSFFQAKLNFSFVLTFLTLLNSFHVIAFISFSHQLPDYSQHSSIKVSTPCISYL